MDLGSTIIGAIILAICIVPFIITSGKRKYKDKKKLLELVNMAKLKDGQISKHEICGDYIIGIDDAKKLVFFLKQRKDNTIEQYINLADIKCCKVANTARVVGGKSSSYNVTDRIELVFIPVDKSKQEITLNFYSSDNCMQLAGEMQSVEKWNKLVNESLKS